LLIYSRYQYQTIRIIYNSYLRSKINQHGHTYKVIFRSILAPTILHDDLLQPLAKVVSWKQFLWGSPELSITNHRITRRKRKLRADCIYGYIRSRFPFTTRTQDRSSSTCARPTRGIRFHCGNQLDIPRARRLPEGDADDSGEQCGARAQMRVYPILSFSFLFSLSFFSPEDRTSGDSRECTRDAGYESAPRTEIEQRLRTVLRS